MPMAASISATARLMPLDFIISFAPVVAAGVNALHALFSPMSTACLFFFRANVLPLERRTQKSPHAAGRQGLRYPPLGGAYIKGGRNVGWRTDKATMGQRRRGGMSIAKGMCSATLRVETTDGVIYARAGGVVTLAGIKGIRAKLTQSAADACVVCLDYSRSLLAITEPALEMLCRSAAPGPSVLVMAWVVPDASTVLIWQRQADLFALRGLQRFVTCRPEEGQAWAQSQATQAAARRARRTVSR